MVSDVRLFGRYLRAVRAYLAEPFDYERCVGLVRTQLAAREASFLDVLRRGVYARDGSPYRRLLVNAGIELGDVEVAVHERGLEAALAELYDSGVYLKIDEFKGNVRVERPGLSFDVSPADFDNPLVHGDWQAQTGGSRGDGRPVLANFEQYTHDTTYYALFVDAFGLAALPTAVWYPLPPGVAGIKTVLMNLKLGRRVDRWVTQTRLQARPSSVRPALLSAAVVAAARRQGNPPPFPRYLPPARAVELARWLDQLRRSGRPGMLQSTPSSGVRVALAAREHGLDVTGSMFRFGGEALTAAKAEVIESVGARAACNYYAAEVGLIGVACSAPTALGDVHMATDKLAVLQRPRLLPTGETVDVLVYTSLLASASKLLLNVESDDYGVLEDRACDCPIGALGLSLHLHTIRSHEKLTSEGTNFLGSAVVSLVEEVLPARFGGSPTDYQLVEAELDGLTRVTVRMSPRVGPVDDAAVVAAVLEFLGAGGRPQALMAEMWRGAGTLQVVRDEPYVTEASKILPLHVL